MIRPLLRLGAALLCLSLLPGCVVWKGKANAKRRAAEEKALAEARKRPLLVGRIALVNPEQRFVLIDAATARVPKAGTTWRAYTEGAVSAELRSTGVRRRPWVIADIVSGTPQTGDTIMQPPEPESSTTPRAEPVRPETPTAPPAKPAPFWKRWLGVFGLGN